MGLVQEIAGTKSLESDALEVTYSLGHLQNIVETHMKMLHELQKRLEAVCHYEGEPTVDESKPVPTKCELANRLDNISTEIKLANSKISVILSALEI